jgi:hypothetical protein
VETQGQLAEAEQRLADYQARKKTIALSSDMTSSIEPPICSGWPVSTSLPGSGEIIDRFD